ncbi:hypothetical protein BDW75DRAFT_250910 [Aspergillus navahoensis]
MPGTDRRSPWEAVAAGTTAAILAHAAVYPLDIIKTKLQVNVQPRRDDSHANYHVDATSRSNASVCGNAINTASRIVREEGILGLYRGLASTTINTASLNFAYFYWVSTARVAYHGLLRSSSPESHTLVEELALSAVGGAVAQLFTNPIAVVATRQQTAKGTDDAKSISSIMKEIFAQDGWTGLWRGFKVNLILVMNPMITYGFYQWLHGNLVHLRRGYIGALETFLLGALSKVLATITTQPLIVAKTMLQSKLPECRQGRPFRGFTDVLVYVIRHEGFWRLYKGLGPQVLKGFLVQGLMVLLKERTELLLEVLRRMGKRSVRSFSRQM